MPQVASMPQCDYAVQSMGTVENAIACLSPGADAGAGCFISESNGAG